MGSLGPTSLVHFARPGCFFLPLSRRRRRPSLPSKSSPTTLSHLSLFAATDGAAATAAAGSGGDPAACRRGESVTGQHPRSHTCYASRESPRWEAKLGHGRPLQTTLNRGEKNGLKIIRPIFFSDWLTLPRPPTKCVKKNLSCFLNFLQRRCLVTSRRPH